MAKKSKKKKIDLLIGKDDKIHLFEVPDYMEEFLKYFMPRVVKLKQEVLERTKDKLGDYGDWKEKCNREFMEGYNELLKDVLKEFETLQLDEYNNGKISLQELEKRLAWIVKQDIKNFQVQ